MLCQFQIDEGLDLGDAVDGADLLVEHLDEVLVVLGDDLDDDLDEVVVGDDEVEEIPVADVRATEEEDEDVPDADDVEASLDVILKERLVVEDEVEDEEAPEPDERGDGTERVLPKQSDEFVCSSCFLVKSSNKLADKKKKLCRDCD